MAAVPQLSTVLVALLHLFHPVHPVMLESSVLELETFYVVLFSVVREFRDQGDAKRIVIRRSLWGHNDTPFGRNGCGLVTIN